MSMEGRGGTEAATREGTRPLRYLVAALFLVLAAKAAATPSAVPLILGRYSKAWFAFQILDLVALGLLLLPGLRAGGRRLGYLGVIASTFVVTSNDAVASIPLLHVFLPMLRMLAALGLVGIEFDRHRAKAGPINGCAAALGMTFILLSILDLGLCVVMLGRKGEEREYRGFRDDYALEKVGRDDIVIVGDSFVWGDGVAKPERFGDQLETLLAAEPKKPRVYSLGVRSAGPARYVESIERVPGTSKANAVVFSFYPNDIDPRPRSRSLRAALSACWSLGRSSLTFRLVHDILAKIDTPNVDAYHASVVEDYREDEPTFARRWADLVAALERFKESADRRSNARPILLLIPLMVDFRTYPLAEVHAKLGEIGAKMGYEVLDLLPEFREKLGDGDKYRVNRADNHFNAEVHRLVAELLRKRLDERKPNRP